MARGCPHRSLQPARVATPARQTPTSPRAPSLPSSPHNPGFLRIHLPLSAPHFLPTPSQSQGPHSPISRFPQHSGHLTSGHHARPLLSLCPLTRSSTPLTRGPPHPAPWAQPHAPHTRPPRLGAPLPSGRRAPHPPRPSHPGPPPGLVRSPRAAHGPRPGSGTPHSRL